ncbi:FAD:protein FMN transferase [Humibacter sp.]|uniref:FAD:protein FMN transferase n=1 Tax=Humibacter sp. TaxID=1940291 RepID=UPI003F7DDA30
MTSIDRRRQVRTDQVMGTVASIHLIVDRSASSEDAALPEELEVAVRACFDELHDLDRVFSTYRPDSDVSRLRAGELDLASADPRVALVHGACVEAKQATGGLFDAWHQGWFDPTGYVKGWAIETTAERALRPLLGCAGVHAVGLGVGGDMQLYTAPGSDWSWRVGIADPRRVGEVVATVEVHTGAVATSGTAERGSHIVDPRTGSPALSVASATVVADGATDADLWATTAVIAGFHDLSWITAPRVQSGLVVSPTGGLRRFARGVELTMLGCSASVPHLPPAA